MSRTSTIPYFPMDTGKFITDTIHLSNAQAGMYARLMALYWENDCNLPREEKIKKALDIRGKGATEALKLVLEEFFPNGHSELLDDCRANALKVSETNGKNRKEGHAKKQQATPKVATTPTQAPTEQPEEREKIAFQIINDEYIKIPEERQMYADDYGVNWATYHDGKGNFVARQL